jgi:hypothetical protein
MGPGPSVTGFWEIRWKQSLHFRVKQENVADGRLVMAWSSPFANREWLSGRRSGIPH